MSDQAPEAPSDDLADGDPAPLEAASPEHDVVRKHDDDPQESPSESLPVAESRPDEAQFGEQTDDATTFSAIDRDD